MGAEWFDGVRFLAAFFSGALMSLAASLIQGITQNDLAGPATLGLDAAMVLLILLAHVVKLWPAADLSWSVEQLALGFFLAAITVAVWGGKWWQRRKVKTYTNKSASAVDVGLIVGLSFNLFVGAFFSLLHFFFMAVNRPFPSELWYGNFRIVPMSSLLLVTLIFIFIYGASYHLRRPMRALSFGHELAAGLGVPVAHLQRQAMLLAFLATAVVDSLFGIFAFMGLIFAHLLRAHPYFSRHFGRELLQGPILAGAMFASLDLFCSQTLFYGAEIPVGLVSGALGTLVLFVLLLKRWSKER